MPARTVTHSAEAQAVATFLALAAVEPSALVVEGVAGIGKTTLWLAAQEQARQRGFQVLSARAAAAESVLAYAALADLLGDVDPAAFAHLPHPQRLALDRVLQWADTDGPVINQNAVAAGFLSLVQRIADEKPVLVAIDDVQWLDPSAVRVLAFAARRLSRAAGLLLTVRTDADSGLSVSWLQLPRPDGIRRIRVPPLSLAGLHAVLTQQLGRSFSRPTMARIHEVSGGNPFYALELGRAMDSQGAASISAEVPADVSLPGSLAELVRARVGSLDTALHDALLAVACLAAPTVELVARATHSDAMNVVKLLEDAESRGVIGIEGHRVQFQHPLLARGVYAEAAPARRRMMHRRLAEIVEQPELAARHLALAATSADSLRSDLSTRPPRRHACVGRLRRPPSSSTWRWDWAATPPSVGFPGQPPLRRREPRSGKSPARGDHRDAEFRHAAGAGVEPARIVRLFDDSFLEAATILERALVEVGEDAALRVQILVTLTFALLNVGHLDAAAGKVEDAVKHAELLGNPPLLSQALGMRTMVRFMRGEGFDAPTMRRALELQGHDADIPLAVRPSVQNALLLAWTGQLDQAREEMALIRRRCIENGQESELNFVALHVVLIEVWRGTFTAAAVEAEDTIERALQLGGDMPLAIALTVRAVLDTYAGRVDDARHNAEEALAASQRSGSHTLAVWPIATLGFLEVSLGNYHAALTTLEPLLRNLDGAQSATEIMLAWFVPGCRRSVDCAGSAGRGGAARRPARQQRSQTGPPLDVGRWWPLPRHAAGR